MGSRTEIVFDSQPAFPQIRGVPEMRFGPSGIRVGSTTPEVLLGITSLRPEITGINFMVYDEESSITKPLSNNRKKDDFFFLERDRISAETLFAATHVLRHLPAEWGEDKTSWALAITSPVIVEGSLGWNHIPMMDFKCTPGEERLKEVRETVTPFAMQGGAILETPNGYHYFGFDLYGDSTWSTFLDKLGKSSLVNPDYINFCRTQRLSSLRVDSGKSFDDTPRVVEVIKPLSLSS